MLSKSDSRYPYTYSADWIRMCGLAESRADAARWASEHCERNGLDVEEFKRQAADKYIEYYNALDKIEAMKIEWLQPII